jgi:hypothetical protein
LPLQLEVVLASISLQLCLLTSQQVSTVSLPSTLTSLYSLTLQLTFGPAPLFLLTRLDVVRSFCLISKVTQAWSIMATPDQIPLKCSICPKKPAFSDLSHLLTHVASKAHLSNYFRLNVQASTDPAIAAIVNEYDTWYSEWGIQNLISERMSLKGVKRPRKSTSKFLVAVRFVANKQQQALVVAYNKLVE